ncbi:MAG: hypothetical protein R2695_10580 [Acidimicrobiales bacterium]
MAGGEVIVIGAKLPPDGPLVGRTLKDIGEEFEPDWDFVVGSISRGEETVIRAGITPSRPATTSASRSSVGPAARSWSCSASTAAASSG